MEGTQIAFIQDHMTSSLYHHPIKFLHTEFRALPKRNRRLSEDLNSARNIRDLFIKLRNVWLHIEHHFSKENDEVLRINKEIAVSYPIFRLCCKFYFRVVSPRLVSGARHVRSHFVSWAVACLFSYLSGSRRWLKIYMVSIRGRFPFKITRILSS